MDEFGVSTCLVGIGEVGVSRISDGFERRDSDGTMVPDGKVDAVKKCVGTGKTVDPSEFSLFDLVVVTGEFSEKGTVNTAIRVSESCDCEAISVAIFSGNPGKKELQSLNRAFGTVILIENSEWIQEVVTDLFTIFSQPMMMHADYDRINLNLKQGGVASLCRFTGDRENLENLVRECRGSGEVLLGYLEAGLEFTVRDAERLERLFESTPVVTGQTTLSEGPKTRLTLLKRTNRGQGQPRCVHTDC